jgi:hypothetical protein
VVQSTALDPNRGCSLTAAHSSCARTLPKSVETAQRVGGGNLNLVVFWSPISRTSRHSLPITLQDKGWFEQRLGPGVTVNWFVYNAGPSATLGVDCGVGPDIGEVDRIGEHCLPSQPAGLIEKLDCLDTRSGGRDPAAQKTMAPNFAVHVWQPIAPHLSIR